MGLSVDILLLILIYNQSFVIDSAKLDFHSIISTFCLNNGFKYVTFINNKCKNSSSLMKINSKGVKGELVKVAWCKKLSCNIFSTYSKFQFSHQRTEYCKTLERGICGSFFLWFSTFGSQVVIKNSSNDNLFYPK